MKGCLRITHSGNLEDFLREVDYKEIGSDFEIEGGQFINAIPKERTFVITGHSEVIPPCIPICNEVLFKAIAALSDTNDYLQWFTNGKGCFVQCLGWFWSESMPEAYIEGEEVGDFYSGFRKATILELCEYFPNNISN